VCGGVLTGLSGSITSPDYPESYPNNAECHWVIQGTSNSIVKLIFVDFQMEHSEQCNFDYVAIFDGPTMEDALLSYYCGNTKPPEVRCLLSTSIKHSQMVIVATICQAVPSLEIQVQEENFDSITLWQLDGPSTLDII
ncbi:hypothetical protein E2320_022924, partial [Naja naja]